MMMTTKNNIQRTVSDISFELMSKEAIDHQEAAALPPISEVEDAKCECCGMSEECTPEYIDRIRSKFLGKWICGLCSEAVKEEMAKQNNGLEAALTAHMSACARFNKFGRAYPVLSQAEAMRELLKRSTRRAQSFGPKSGAQKVGGLARSSSCIPAITRDLHRAGHN
ncbi:unnamed protein product [Linum trigynum]|uniref:DUF1677 family protein n=1 Tax=Linum trigynum TaxID=586398 RepID=A0AAV2DXF8_9ROSI